jgi:MFS transporter, AAHS family, 4-hydroxybenzoate transporter
MTEENSQKTNPKKSDKMSSYQWMIVLLCFLLNFNDGIDVLVVSFAGPHIQKEWLLSNAELGYIFSAGLAGMTIGCFSLAPWGDIIGRRKAFLISLFLISAGMLLVYQSNSYSWMLCFRFITGLGIGGILPNLATVAAEFSSNNKKDFAVGMVQGGWPLGAILTGFAVAYIIPAWGWRTSFLIAGFFSATLWFIVLFLLPESPAFLSKENKVSAFRNLQALFTPTYKKSTLLIWTAIFFGFITLYTLMSWIPTIAKNSGMPFQKATYAGTFLNLGAFIGVFVMGLSISKWGIKKVMLVYLCLACACMIVYGTNTWNYGLHFLWIGCIGFLVQGGFNAFYPATTRIYPDSIRSTGVGMAMGVGRLGAILGPTLFGFFTDWGFSVANRFIFFSIPLLIAAILVQTIRSKNIS